MDILLIIMFSVLGGMGLGFYMSDATAKEFYANANKGLRRENKDLHDLLYAQCLIANASQRLKEVE